MRCPMSNSGGKTTKTLQPKAETVAAKAATPMLTVKGIAALLHVSERHVWRLRSAGKLPQPIRIGRSVRWTQQSIAAFIEKGGTDNARR